MKDVNWREIVEIVGIVSIVGSLLLVATEVRQSNNIANAEIEMNIANEYNTINFERATNAEFAKLYAKMGDPASHLITATEYQQIRGLAWHYLNIYWLAQTANNNGLMSGEQLLTYAEDLDLLLKRQPALQDHFIALSEMYPGMTNMQVFAPVAKLIEVRTDENQ